MHIAMLYAFLPAQYAWYRVQGIHTEMNTSISYHNRSSRAPLTFRPPTRLRSRHSHRHFLFPFSFTFSPSSPTSTHLCRFFICFLSSLR